MGRAPAGAAGWGGCRAQPEVPGWGAARHEEHATFQR